MSGDLHPWRILDVQDGAVGWIQGRLVGEPPLIAPLSKRACFYYSLLEEGKGARNTAADELVIDDGSGHAIIELAGATIQVNYDFENNERLGVDPRTNVVLLGALRREGVLAPDEVVAVHGHCNWELDPSPNARYGLYRDPLPRRLRITGTSHIQIWVTERL
jgi:hypothetical protein